MVHPRWYFLAMKNDETLRGRRIVVEWWYWVEDLRSRSLLKVTGRSRRSSNTLSAPVNEKSMLRVRFSCKPSFFRFILIFYKICQINVFTTESTLFSDIAYLVNQKPLIYTLPHTYDTHCRRVRHWFAFHLLARDQWMQTEFRREFEK